MKQELTVVVDSALLPAAERYARAEGISLSKLVEQSLRSTVDERSPSFASRWRGAFQAAERDDSRYGSLAEKHRL